VYCAITGYGQDGPWRDRAGHDLNYIATAGVLDQIGAAGGPPAIPNLQIGDLLGGALTAAMGILAAVIGARASGQGRYVDVAMTDAALAHAYSPLLSMLTRGKTLLRGSDDLSGGLPAYRLYRTQDGRFIAVGALEPKFWQVFCAAIGRADLVPFGLARGEDGERVQHELEALFASRPLADWATLFERVDCGVTPVLSFEEAMAHPQLQARGMLREIEGLKQFAPPLKMSDWEFAVRQPAPKVGADGTALLREAGYSDAEIESLRERGVI
ncbi:MAG: CaiB/BaiF CoA transferase family protein, partial [Rhodocyclaceae bacterium]